MLDQQLQDFLHRRELAEDPGHTAHEEGETHLAVEKTAMAAPQRHFDIYKPADVHPKQSLFNSDGFLKLKLENMIKTVNYKYIQILYTIT